MKGSKVKLRAFFCFIKIKNTEISQIQSIVSIKTYNY